MWIKEGGMDLALHGYVPLNVNEVNLNQVKKKKKNVCGMEQIRPVKRYL
jgi:hypothetical protein